MSMPEPLATRRLPAGMAEESGVDQWLDHLDTIAYALEQRRMTTSQRQRLYDILERIYADARGRKRSRAA